jgi:hypothetical protein
MLGSRSTFCRRSVRERRDEAIAHNLCGCGHRCAGLVDWRAPLATTPLTHAGSWLCNCADHSVPYRDGGGKPKARAIPLGNERAAAHAPPTMALAESRPVRRGETTIPISEIVSVTRTDEVTEPKPRMPQARSPWVRSSGSLGTCKRFVKTLAQSNSNGEKAIPAPQRRPPRKDVYS